MKRALILVILLLAAPAAAIAQGLCPLETYLAAFDAKAYGAEWTEEADGRVLSMSPEADVLVSLAVEDGQLLAVSVAAPKGEARATYALAAMPPTGTVTAERLEALLQAGATAETGDALLTLAGGALREGAYLCAAGELAGLCWQPMHGGENRHRTPVCSGMDGPRLIPLAAAEALGLGPCEHCFEGESQPAPNAEAGSD